MKKLFAVLLLCAISAMAAMPINARAPLNSEIVWEDSIYLDGTETHYTTAAWLDNGAEKTLVVEARDDSITGWSSDTSTAAISLIQLFPITKGGKKYFVRLPSKAHPDSTAFHPAEFKLWSALAINTMDTAAVYLRNAVIDTNSNGSQRNVFYGDSLKTLTTAGMGAFAYHSLVPDYGPAVCLKITGSSINQTKGTGTFWRFRIYQAIGQPMKAK